MRAAVILGLGCSAKNLAAFQRDAEVEWRMRMPAADDPADVIVLFGGDGTIHRHLGQLVTLELPVLVVPVGSGNDFARALGMRSVRDSLLAWRRFCSGAGNVRSIDLGVIFGGSAEETSESSVDLPVRGRYFCCVAGVGLDAEVARRANFLPRWLRGHGGYTLSLLPTIFQFAPFPLRILTAKLTDKESGDQRAEWAIGSDQPTILAAFANTSTYGGGMKIAPHAKMDDGLLDVCVVGGLDAFKLFCLFPTVYGGRHLKIREVKYFQAGRMRVETEQPMDVYADGEFVCRTPVEMGVQSSALRVVT
jgi:diacylglycerol kinase family enzyme